jgi:TolB-like protein/DNA-binding winged helix-turn-helix (wHTH) protein
VGEVPQAEFRIDDLRVNPQSGEVTGPAGREMLDPKVMDVLAMLALHAGQVVPREDLLARVWPGSVVTDDALTRCIYELRRQLSLAGGDERYKAVLETIPKRGYRLNAAVSPVGEEIPEPAQKRRRWWPAALVAAATAAGVAAVVLFGLRPEPAVGGHSIAVLPFVDLSPEQDQEHFSDGISEEILNRLNQSPTLKVIARPSSFSFKGQATSIPEIAAQLHVTHVLEGSVRKSGNRIRLTVRLEEAATNAVVWSNAYDYELGDIFEIQEEIAARVATALDAKLAAGPAHAPKEAALEPFLLGEFFYNRRGEGDIERAVRYYLAALVADPEYAKAWASLSGAYSLLAFNGTMNRDEALAKQHEAARKAVSLDPNLAVGHARLAQYYWDIGDRESSYRTLDRAISLDPNDLLVLTFLAGIAMRNGDVDGALQRYDRIVARDPRSASHRANRGVFLQAAGRFEEAITELDTAKEFNPDLAPEIDLTGARILIVKGRLAEASRRIDGLPEGSAGRAHGLALLYFARGQSDAADQALESLALHAKQPVDIRLAEVYAFRGMRDRAFDTLDGLLDVIDRNAGPEASQLWSWQVELRVSPFLAPLHNDPRWKALLVEPRAFRA